MIVLPAQTALAPVIGFAIGRAFTVKGVRNKIRTTTACYSIHDSYCSCCYPCYHATCCYTCRPVPLLLTIHLEPVAFGKRRCCRLMQTEDAPPPIAAITGNAFTVRAWVAVFEQVPLLTYTLLLQYQPLNL